MFKEIISHKTLRICLTIFIAALLSGSQPVQPAGATKFVTNTNDSGPGSLRYLIDLASDSDTIYIAVNGTITLTTGPITIDDNIIIHGLGAGELSISGNNSSRVFYIPADTSVTIRDVSIVDGSANYGAGIVVSEGTLLLEDCNVNENSAADSGNGDGGGIYVWRGTLTTNDCSIYDNDADGNGGGIFIFESTVTLNNSTHVYDNTGGLSGGGICNDGTLELNDSTVGIDNSTSGDGGGIFNLSGSVTLNNSTITGNDAGSSDEGGGIYNYSGSVTLNNSTISGNGAYYGAGIYNQTDGITVTLNKSTISGNSAEYGGGIYSYSTVTLNNSTISGNDALKHAGGIYNYDATLTLNHSTITDNTADSNNDILGSGGGIVNFQDAGTAVVNFKNSIVAGNHDLSGTGAEDCMNSSGTLNSNDYNLTGIGTGCSLVGAHDQTTADPLLFALTDNGGDTETHALDTGSPAINKIPYGKNGCGTTYTEDQRGVTRPQGYSCDIGAFELEITGDTIGMYSRGQKTWYLKDANTDGWGDVTTVRFGSTDSSWVPMEGDWNGNGTDTIGMYSRTQKTWYLKGDNIDGWGNVTTVRFGSTDSSWLPVVGDWDGDGTDTIGMYSRTQKTWYLKDSNTDGWGDVTTVRFGSTDSSWIPVVGDWNNCGPDKIGLYSRTQKTWYLKGENIDGWVNYLTYRFGSTDSSWIPVVGDWDGDGTEDKIGMYSRTQKTWYLKDTNTDGWGDVTTVRFGSTDTSWVPVTGKW